MGPTRRAPWMNREVTMLWETRPAQKRECRVIPRGAGP